MSQGLQLSDELELEELDELDELESHFFDELDSDSDSDSHFFELDFLLQLGVDEPLDELDDDGLLQHDMELEIPLAFSFFLPKKIFFEKSAQSDQDFCRNLPPC